MATSGSLTAPDDWSNYGWVNWSLAGQSVEGNYSVINYSCGVYVAHTFYSNAVSFSGVTISGVSGTVGANTWSNIAYESCTSASGQGVIYHDSNGNANISIGSFTAWFYPEHYGSSGGGTWALPTIARKSSLSNVSSSVVVNDSNKITGTINRQSSSFTHTLTLSFGGTNYDISSSISGTSISYTVPTSILSNIPSSTSGSATLTLTTYSGSTNLGTATASLTLSVPDYSYTIGTITATPEYYSGTNPFGSVFVKLLTKAAISFPQVTGQYGATLTHNITIGNSQYSGYSCTTGLLQTSGTVTITATVTDSRGVSQSKNTTITVYDYNYPSVAVGASLQYGSTSATVTIRGQASTVNGNYITVSTIKRTDETTSTETTLSTPSELQGQIAISTFNNGISFTDSGVTYSHQYSYSITLADKATTITGTGVSGRVVISRHSGGDGVTLGREADAAGFNCYYDASFADASDTLTALSYLIYPVGSIYITTSSISPVVIYGGTWEQITDKFLLGAGDTYTAGDTGGEATNMLTASNLPNFAWANSITVTPTSLFAPTIPDSSGYANFNPRPNQGTQTAVNNMPPYLAVYIWKRLS